jgi:hypothetical protein
MLLSDVSNALILEESRVLVLQILDKYRIPYSGKEHLLKVAPTRKRWTNTEREGAYADWKAGMSSFDLVCKYNRNPKDLQMAISAICKVRGDTFKNTKCARIDSKENWNKDCADELYEAGLPLWKISIALNCELTFVSERMINRGHGKKRNQVSTDHKWFVNELELKDTPIKIRSALDAYGGLGHSAEIVRQAFPKAHIDVVEIKEEFYNEGKQRCPSAVWHLGDNIEFIKSTKRTYDFIDLDPFSNSYDLLQLIWKRLRKKGVFFLTFGGEYLNAPLFRNRISIRNRYGFDADHLEFKPYQDTLPYYFLGWVLKQANDNGYVLNVNRGVRYMSICRFWGTFSKQEVTEPQYIKDNMGWKPRLDFYLPRFSEVRGEMRAGGGIQGSLF